MPGVTPSQTIGPFFAVMTPLGSSLLVEPGSPDAILVHGQVFDGAGEPLALFGFAQRVGVMRGRRAGADVEESRARPYHLVGGPQELVPPAPNRARVERFRADVEHAHDHHRMLPTDGHTGQ